jgi:hypothetical protein
MSEEKAPKEKKPVTAIIAINRCMKQLDSLEKRGDVIAVLNFLRDRYLTETTDVTDL